VFVAQQEFQSFLCLPGSGTTITFMNPDQAFMRIPSPNSSFSIIDCNILYIVGSLIQ
jgi:hypothetical protein